MNALAKLPRVQADTLAAQITAFGPAIKQLGAELYAVLCARIPEDPELLEIASHGLAAFPATHLLNAVHYLLMRDPSDPLARYYATLIDTPAPPEEAFADFARYCKAHRQEILEILATRTIQATTPERCTMLMPLLS